MKKCMFILTIMVAGLCKGAKAQIQQGNFLIGADLTNIDLSLDKGGNFSFLVNPKLAFFIRDNVALGGYVTAGLSTAKGAGTNVNYGIGILGRYYAGPKDITTVRHARLFAEGTVGIEGYNPAVGDNTNGLGIGVGPGIAYFITPTIGLEGLLKYNGIVGFGTAPTSNHLNLSLGFQIYLPSSRAKAIREDIKSN